MSENLKLLRMKTLFPTVFMCLGLLSHELAATKSIAQESSPGSGVVVRVAPTNAMFLIPCSKSNLLAITRGFYFDRPSLPDHRNWCDELVSVFVPATGAAWTGQANESHLAALDGCVIGFSPVIGSSMRAFISTNQYSTGQTNIDGVFKSERDFYCDLKRRNGYLSPYVVSVAGLFQNLPRVQALKSAAGFSGLKTEVSVESSYAVVTFHFETDLVGKVGFNGKLEPVWATTNGIVIHSIPTNTVVFIDGGSIPRASKIVY